LRCAAAARDYPARSAIVKAIATSIERAGGEMPEQLAAAREASTFATGAEADQLLAFLASVRR
jgi:hypothetical protein